MTGIRAGGVSGTGGANLLALRSHNAALLLDLLRWAGRAGVSRLELAERTGLTPQAVSKITARLREDGLVTEAGRQASTGGKPGTLLRLVPEAGHAVGLHLDRDELWAVLVDLTGTVVAERRAALDLGAGAEAVLTAVVSEARVLVEELRGAPRPDGTAVHGRDGRYGREEQDHRDGPGGRDQREAGGGDRDGRDGSDGRDHRGGGELRGGGEIPGDPDDLGAGGVGGAGSVGGTGEADGASRVGGADGADRADGADKADSVSGTGGTGGAHGPSRTGGADGASRTGGAGRADGADGAGAVGELGPAGQAGETRETGEAGGDGPARDARHVGDGRQSRTRDAHQGRDEPRREESAARPSLLGVGVAMPGPLDHTHGVPHRVTGFPEWDGFPLRDALARRLGAPVVLDKDTNAAAHGLAVGGEAGAFAYLHLGTGLGAGLVLGGAVYRGARTGAGEFGHQVIQLDGPDCPCGNRGCVEALCLAAVARGDIDEAARVLGEGAANLVGLLDIELVLLGGRTVAAEPDRFVRGVGAVLDARARREGASSPVPVRIAPGGARAVAEGAAQLLLAPLFGRARG